MRLFVAVELPEDVRDNIASSAEALRGMSRSGTFSRRENYHITLAFLGEVDGGRVPSLREALDRAAQSCTPALVKIGGIGHFGGMRGEGDVRYRHVSSDGTLERMAEVVRRELARTGFTFDPKPFRAHITIARRVKLCEDADVRALSLSLPETVISADSFTLMLSERLDGKLTYTPLYRVHI